MLETCAKLRAEPLDAGRQVPGDGGPGEPGRAGATPGTLDDLISNHGKAVIRVALRMLGCLDEARNAAQEVFLRAHRYGASRDPRLDPGPWLYRITVNVCNETLGLRRRRAERPLAESEREQLRTPPGEGSCPESGLLERERRDILARALLTLPERERAAVILRDVEGLTTAEAARALGTSEATVRSHSSHGRQRLREYVQRVFGRRS
ncbi:MAG: sigma-70 family RNA polymerase sigma factor [Acidobacteria bacterium]|nr:sigma-70 family RNA polymerase sigma factor [Acidobacteriota bacterium]